MRRVKLFATVLFLLSVCVVPRLAKADNNANNPCNFAVMQNSSTQIPTAVTTQIINATAFANQSTYVCQIYGSSPTANATTLEYGTGTLCGTGTVVLAKVSIALGGPWAENPAFYTVPPLNNICLITSTATALSYRVLYVQQ